jgi:hypothetical protein
MPIKNNYLGCLIFCNKETKESCKILSTPLIHKQFFCWISQLYQVPLHVYSLVLIHYM